MRKYLILLAVIGLVSAGVMSCSDHDDPVLEVEDYAYTPASDSEMRGLYVYSSTDSIGSSFLMGIQFDEGDSVKFYMDVVTPSGTLAVPFGAHYWYNAETGYGAITDGETVIDFFVDKNGFIVLFDSDNEHKQVREGMWLNKRDYDITALMRTTTPYVWEYASDFGCEENDSTRLIDVEDIGYQDGGAIYNTKTRGFAKDEFEWTVANVAKWAGANIASGAVSALASVGVNAIMTQIGVGMGAQLNNISKQLNEVMVKLDQILPKINQLLDGQAEAHFNDHKRELNELSNIVVPCFLNVMDQKDSVKRMEYLKEFNDKQGTNKTNTFLDNIATLTIQNKMLYEAYDKYIYQCYPWEEQGYTARESFRANDMICAFMGTVLSALYYSNKGDTITIKQHFSKFARYMDYYNKTMVKRDENYAVSQIAGCKIRINKKVDKRDYKNQTWLANGVEFETSYFESSNPYRCYWVPRAMVYSLCYGNSLGFPEDTYHKMGLTESEVNALLKFYGNKKSLQDILFTEAKCVMPFSESELNGKTLCIMRGNTSCDYNKDKTGSYASKDEICFSAYTKDNKFLLRRVGVPKIGTKDGKRLWYTLFIKKEKISIFNGWSQYNDNNLWCYPTVIR